MTLLVNVPTCFPSKYRFAGASTQSRKLKCDYRFGEAIATFHTGDDFLTRVAAFCKTDLIPESSFQRNIIWTEFLSNSGLTSPYPQRIKCQ